MFKVVAERTFTHDVKVLMPSDSGHSDETLKTTFVCLDSDKIKTFDLSTEEGTSGFLDVAVKAFGDLIDDNGRSIDCTPEVREQLLRNPNIRLALSAHYFAAVTKAPVGN